MKQSSHQSKKPFHLPDFEHRLNMYALAASAAGVSMLALAQPAEGKIIYTKANKQIGVDTTFHLDLNHDGIADFDLTNSARSATYSGWDWLSAIPARPGNAVWGHTIPNHAYASALYANVQVGPKGRFLPSQGLMASTYFLGGRARPLWSGTCRGPWGDVANRYLGFKFVIAGKVHFGWGRLNVSCVNGTATVSATLTGYAYETIPNKPIVTGKVRGGDELDRSIPTADGPVTLGQLARGVR